MLGNTFCFIHNYSLLLYVSGVFSAAHDLKMEWVVVKGISGYADGTEERENWQTFASVTAASLVANILKVNRSTFIFFRPALYLLAVTR